MIARIIPITLLSLVCCLAPPAPVHAFDIWRHPEIAGKNTLFIDTAVIAVSFYDGFIPPPPLDIRLDYMLPVFLPFSLGAYMKTPDPNLKSFGVKMAYHFDLRVPQADFYAAYAFDLGFVRNKILEEYGDEKQDIHYYDFRIGVRYLFGIVGIALETGFKLRGFDIALSIKLL